MHWTDFARRKVRRKERCQVECRASRMVWVVVDRLRPSTFRRCPWPCHANGRCRCRSHPAHHSFEPILKPIPMGRYDELEIEGVLLIQRDKCPAYNWVPLELGELTGGATDSWLTGLSTCNALGTREFTVPARAVTRARAGSPDRNATSWSGGADRPHCVRQPPPGVRQLPLSVLRHIADRGRAI